MSVGWLISPIFRNASCKPSSGILGFRAGHPDLKPVETENLRVVGSLRRRFAGCEIWPVPGRTAQLLEPLERGGFDDGFVEAHVCLDGDRQRFAESQFDPAQHLEISNGFSETFPF